MSINRENILRSNCYFYNNYSDSDKIWFEKLLTSFTNNTKFVGVGITITSKMKIIVGGWAIRMIIKLPLGSYYFSHVKVINIFPGYQVSEKAIGEMNSGYFYCHINLAWDSVKKDITNSNGSNVVVHEFAHSIDLLDRVTNGFPSTLLKNDEAENWKKVFNPDYILNNVQGKKIWNYLELSRWREYNKNERVCVDVAEMFAVSTEKYFEDTARLYHVAPEIYQQMEILYKQDMLHKVKKQTNILLKWGYGLWKMLTKSCS